MWVQKDEKEGLMLTGQTLTHFIKWPQSSAYYLCEEANCYTHTPTLHIYLIHLGLKKWVTLDQYVPMKYTMHIYDLLLCIYVCVHVCAHVHVPGTCRCPWGQEEETRHPRTGGAVSTKSSDVAAGNWTQVLSKSSKCSSTPSHLCRHLSLEPWEKDT